MGSVVTKDVGSYEIWAGNPAKPIRKRFSDNEINSLKSIKWWENQTQTIEEIANDFNND